MGFKTFPMFATFPKDHLTNIKWYEKFLSEVRDNTILVINKYMTEVEFGGNLMRPKSIDLSQTEYVGKELSIIILIS